MLLPGAYYFMREKTIAAGEAVAASGCADGGGDRYESGNIALLFAATGDEHGMRALWINAGRGLAGTTLHAAQALGRSAQTGTIAVGKVADLLIWNIDHPAEIVCSLGVNPLVHRVFRGHLDASQS